MKMKDEDFPNYFQASDKASNNSQKYYLYVVRVDLISMIIAAAFAIFNYQLEERKLFLHILTGLSLSIGVIATIILLCKKFEDYWYQGRALAESCKTITWRFVSRAEYFEREEIDLDEIQVRNKFIERIKSLANEFPELKKIMSSKILSKSIITDKMLEIREWNLEERKDFYTQERIIDQKEWYSDRAYENKKAYNFWFGFIIISQVIAIFSTVYLIKYPESNWNLISLFTTLSASAISWLQIRQHQALKQAYTTAAEELNYIQELAKDIITEEDFAEFVLDSENAISREHTVWLAQRRK